MEKLLIYGIFIIALFGGLIKAIGIPDYYTIATEIFIVYLFLISPLTDRNRHGYSFHLWYVFLFMLFISICSMAINQSGFLPIIYSFRLLFRFYLFYLAIITISYDDDSIKKLNKLLITLLLLELPVVAYKFHLYGINERTMGAYVLDDGSLATILPITVIFYLLGFYFLYQPKRWYLLAAFGFVLLSIAGKKRAVFFLYPLQALVIYYYIYVKGKGVSFSKKLGTFILLCVLIGGISGSILSFNDTLNPEGKIGGSVNAEYAIRFAQKYTMAENGYGYSTGRLSTTIRIFENLWSLGFTNICLGIGPGSLTASVLDIKGQMRRVVQTKNELGFAYGTTAMSKIAVEYGVLGIIVYSLMIFSFARMSWRYYSHEVDPYWKAFAAGSVGFAFAMLFFFFAYGDTAIWGGTIPPLYFYAMAIVYTRSQRISDHVSSIDLSHKRFDTKSFHENYN